MDTLNPSPNTGQKTGLAIAALIIGVVVGTGAGYALGMRSTDNKPTTSMNESSTAMNSNTDGVLVGGAKMVSSKDIVDNAANAKNVTTVVAAVQAAGLVDTLKSAGPFTVFGPNNAAFNKLPAGTVDTLLKPENKTTLQKILTYHVVAGTFTSADLRVPTARIPETGGALCPFPAKSDCNI